MKICKCIALLSFMLLLDMAVTAQDCQPTDCLKSSTSAALIENSVDADASATITANASQGEANCSKVCDPANCPPLCRIICKATCDKSTSMVTVNTEPKAYDLVMLLPDRPIPTLSAPGLHLEKF
ncbi:MAG: hypothetical protein OEQ53_17810 [Saprospiraceae bacterium]|nr:hypothetical protein [Saprospiraceae bacterium]